MGQKTDSCINEDQFDYQAFESDAINDLRSGKPLEGKDGILAPLIKRLVEASLEGEMDAHLNQKDLPNRRNGKSSKRVKTGVGNVEIITPRDRQSTFTPQVLPKRQTVLGESLDQKVINLYARGMSYNDICDHLEELYGLVVSPSSLTAITDRVLDDVKAWQNRPLESVYPIVWLDAIHYKVREKGAIKKKAVNCIIGVNREGIKDLLGLYISETEGARYWLNVLSDIQNRGVRDIFIACVDGLKGFADAIESLYPECTVQLCVIHQVRQSTRYVAYKDIKDVMESLKNVYQAPNLSQAEIGLEELKKRWNEKYPYMVRSWINNWPRLSSYLNYPADIRRVIYTTNIIESFHSQLRKVTKTKRVFSSDQSLLKLLYLVFHNLKKGWSGPIAGWKLTSAQFMILFEKRMLKP